jgi:predicted transcriptional regulator
MGLRHAAALALLSLLLVPLAVADASPVELVADPPTLRLTAGGAADVHVMATNRGDRPVDVRVDLRDTVFPADARPGSGVAVTIPGGEAAQRLHLAPGASGRVAMQVKASGGSPVGALADLIVVATQEDDATAQTVVHVEVGDLPAGTRAAQLVAASGVGAAVAMAAGVLALLPAARGAALAPFVALYSRVADREALAQETRRRIHDVIAASPGVGQAQLLRRAGVGAGALTRHLRVLERAGLVVVRRRGTRRALYPSHHPDARVPHRATSDAQERVLAALSPAPLTQRELAERLGLSQQGVSHHVRRLERLGLVRALAGGRAPARWARAS